MKKIIHAFVLLFLMPLMACAEQYQEGKHYEVVSEQLSAKSEVREYFSFYCPHCYNFEPLMHDIEKSLPEGTTFEKNHVNFMGGASKKIQTLLTHAMLVGEQLDMAEKVNGAIFNYIHRQRAVFTEERDIRNVLVMAGVDGEKFDKLMKSFAISSKAKLLEKYQDDLGKTGKLKSVPTVVVNGKYKVLTTDLNKDDQQGDFIAIVKYLLTLK
jgi:thiol:disulfide interchange protein DsbA